MTSHIGTRCMVCSEKFTFEDDVVICPECGTPYHRACYEKSGSCVNTALHKSGGTWKPSYDVGSDGAENSETVCAFCGYTNPPLTLFCRRCGMPAPGIHSDANGMEQRYDGVNINDDPDAYNRNANSGMFIDPFFVNFSDPLCGLSPDEDFDGVKLAELGDHVGTNTHYYIPLFKQFKELGRKFSLNFPAMLFPEFYFAYRKMPLMAVLALILKVIAALPQFIYLFSGTSDFGILSVFASQFDVRSAAFRGVVMLGTAISYAAMFTFGMFGNRLYYDHSLKHIKKLKELFGGMAPRDVITKKGGTSALLLVLFICIEALPYAAMYLIRFFSMTGMN